MRHFLAFSTALLTLLLLLCVGVVLTTSVEGGAAPVYVHDFFTTHALPSQIHIALADHQSDGAGKNRMEGELQNVGMTVSWATAARTKSSVVRYGQNAANLSSEARAETPCEQYEFCDYTSPWFHHVTIEGDLMVSGTTFYCE